MSSHPDLPLEQARNAEYLKKLKAWLEKPVQYGISRNEVWVNPASNGHGKSYGALHPLIGRVGLSEPDEFLGPNFYIGARRFDGDMQTVSWLAPVARAFYQPYDPPEDLNGRIVGIRTFTHHVDELTAIDEEWLKKVRDSPFAQTELTVESPRSRSSRRPVAPPQKTPPATKMRPSTPESAESQPTAGGERLAGMRASGAVLGRLAAPRSSEMGSVLATLQPDQHDLVTRPADKDLVIQGHPGTGKTVVAAYRAGFLVAPSHPERQEFGGGQKRVLLIGPTPGYVKHVSGLLRPFQYDGTGQITVTDLGKFMANIVGLSSPWSGAIDGEPSDLDARAFELVRRVADLIRENSARSRTGYRGTKDAAKRDLELTYTTLRQNGMADKPITEDVESVRWLARLPSFANAVELRRYLPLLAQCRMAQWPELARGVFDHIVVDEAQDVSPMEWSILEQYQHPWKSRWTLVGDQNQRRSNISYTSWRAVADHLHLNDGEATEPQIMSRGYRSTNAILEFADGLLGPSLRKANSIQDEGAPVQRIKEPKSKRLHSRALSVASGLARKYAGGTVALITVYPDNLIKQMGAVGWRRPNPNDVRTWALDDVTLQVYSPERVRGLEFDAVVVIEPRQFDNDNGRHGQLYTSLTRANRELAIVHHQALPSGLRTPK